MPTKDFEARIEDEMHIWAARVFERIRKKFIDMDINRTANNEKGFTGNLYRSLFWDVHSAAGGSKVLVRFFYLKYGNFVQWGVGRQFGDPRWPKGQDKWPIPPLYGRDAAGIEHPEYKTYKAKPFLRREVNYGVKRLIRDLAVEYAYFADFHIIKSLSDGMGDRTIMEKWISENKDELSNDFLQAVGMKR